MHIPCHAAAKFALRYTGCRYGHRLTTLQQLRHASTALPSSAVAIDEKLVRLARQTLSKAATASSSDTSNSSLVINDIDAAKRTKQLETLRDALKDWQTTFDVSVLRGLILCTCFFFWSKSSDTQHSSVKVSKMFLRTTQTPTCAS